MSEHTFYADPAALAAAVAGASIVVAGDEGHHGARVRRLAAGELVDLVDGLGRRAHGVVTDVAAASFTVELAEVADEPPAQPRITVVQALAKGDRALAAVEMLTECGVDALVPWAAQRSVAVWRGEKADRGVQRWRAVARAAAKQARRARVPDVAPLAGEAGVADLLAGADLALVLHESAAARLARVALPQRGSVALVVGPEGGICPAELDRFAAAGALSVRLGESVLRTGTAGVAAAAVVLAGSGRWT